MITTGIAAFATMGRGQAFETAIARYVDDQLTVVVLTNLADAEPGTISRHVTELYLTEK